MPERWPLVGRDEELRLLDDVLGAGRPGALVLTGPAGVGKTRLAAEAIARVAASGLGTARAVASRSAATVPFGALAPLLPGPSGAAETAPHFLRRALDHIAGAATALWIDDAHELDDASATLVHQLVIAGSVRVLLTVRSGSAVPDALVTLEKDGLAARLELAALRRPEVERLVREVLGGPAEGDLVQHLWSGSEGNPLVLRELLAGALATDTLVRRGGLWRLDGRPAPSRPLRELVEHRLSLVEPDERAALEVLAVAETIGLTTFVSLVGELVVEQVERRELVTVGTDGRRRPVRLAHPVHGEVLRDAMPVTRHAALQRRLAAAVRDAGAHRRGDATRVAALLLGADGRADLEVLEQAVAESLLTLDAELLEQVARAGLEAGGGRRFVRLLGETLRWQGRPVEAERLLADVDLATVEDEEDLALIAMVRADCLFRALGDLPAATAVLDAAEPLLRDPAWLEELAVLRCSFRCQVGQLHPAVEELRRHARSPHVRVVLAALPALVPPLTMAGRYEEAVALADHGWDLGMRTGPLPLLSDPGLHAVLRAIALCDGGRLVEADATANLGYDWSLDAGNVAGRGWFALVLGYCGLAQGRLVEALERLREAANVFGDLAEPGMRRLALASAVGAAGQLGDALLGAELLDEVKAVGDTTMALGEVEVDRAQAWLAVAAGRRDEARDLLRRSCERGSEEGFHGLVAFALHDLVRLGDARWAAGRLEGLRDLVEGPLLPVRADHATALAAGDGPGLEVAADAYEALGGVLWAAEAAAQAAAAHRRAGDPGRAAVCEVRSDALAGRCEGAATPALRTRTAREPGALTRREREVAVLASRGASSKAIAGELYLSVRTVENHLQRAYAKLGISGRSALVTALARGSNV